MPLTRQAPVRPYQVKRINAGSAVDVAYVSRDDELNEVALSKLRWRYDNLTDSVELQGWEEIEDPEARGAITIPASLNTMSRDYRDKQLNQITFELTDTNGNVRQQLAYVELSAVFVGATAS